MKLVDYDMHIFMNPSLVCTFDCIYCGQHNNNMGSVKSFEIEKFVKVLDRFNKTFLVTVSGGEPFLIPNFIEFASALTKNHHIRIDTNLSLKDNCRKFVNTINPDKVAEIVFSTHVLEREKRGIDPMELVSLVNEFQEKGFRMLGNYVAFPPLVGRMEKDIAFFNSHGIKVLPTLFCGKFNGKNYPLDEGRISYSKDELDLITRLNPYAKIPLWNPQNEFCQAGCTAFFVNDKYEVSPCFTMRDIKLGDFFGQWKTFPKVIKCPRQYCTDQYNKTLNCSLSYFHLGLSFAQIKAMSDKGTCSKLETSVLLAGGLKNLLSNKIMRH